MTSSNGNRIPVRTSRSGTAHEIVLALARRGLTVASLDGPKVTLSGANEARRVPDLLVLDGGSAPALEALRRLATEVRPLPALFLLGPDHDPVLASTDCVVAPITASEVGARLGPAPGERTAARHVLADLELDDDAHEVRRGGTPSS